MSDNEIAARELLGHILIELRQRTAADNSRYDVIRAAGLLRLLLVDRRAPTLLQDALGAEVDGLRFEVRTPVSVTVVGTGDGNGATILSRGLVPYDTETNTASLTLMEFCALEAAQIAVRGAQASESRSVDDVVRYAANVLGGVHYRQPKSAREKVTAELLASHDWDDLPWTLRDIAGVVLNALCSYEPESPGVVLKSSADFNAAVPPQT
ncbi:hypothetical protein RDV89_00960 [Nocardioides zeae]|uniref:Uncharacterized protein n=1 Tax=Nocardioides imazamoxiresistens TaxID=3231893 RepID=A0ABU3PQV8_9ACTN|nr:hypothetical protein [Nocardioides zeae]MDT9591616.1 hypothetical protein [Nocardioides zeae]